MNSERLHGLAKIAGSVVLAATLSGCASAEQPSQPIPTTSKTQLAPTTAETCGAERPAPLESHVPAYPDFNQYMVKEDLRPGTRIDIEDANIVIGPQVSRLNTWKITDPTRAEGIYAQKGVTKEDYAYQGSANGTLTELVTRPSHVTDYQSGSSWLEYFSKPLGRFVAVDITDSSIAPYITLPDSADIMLREPDGTYNTGITEQRVDPATIVDLSNGNANIFYTDANCKPEEMMIGERTQNQNPTNINTNELLASSQRYQESTGMYLESTKLYNESTQAYLAGDKEKGDKLVETAKLLAEMAAAARADAIAKDPSLK